MIEGTGTIARNLQKKRSGIASTRTTNELVDAINACGQVVSGGNADPQPGIKMVRIRVLANLTGGGKYTGYIRAWPNVSIDPDTDLSDEELGENGQPCYIINPPERGLSTHDLTETPQQTRDFVGHLLPEMSEAGYPWVEITGYDIYAC